MKQHIGVTEGRIVMYLAHVTVVFSLWTHPHLCFSSVMAASFFWEDNVEEVQKRAFLLQTGQQ